MHSPEPIDGRDRSSIYQPSPRWLGINDNTKQCPYCWEVVRSTPSYQKTMVLHQLCCWPKGQHS